MSSKLLNAALAALLVGGTGLALADDDGRGRRHGDGDHRGWHQRDGDRGAPRWNAHPPQQRYRAPFRHHGWQGHGYGHGQEHWRHPHGWGHGHRYAPHHGYHHGYSGHYAKPYADYGDDITIIFRGSLD